MQAPQYDDACAHIIPLPAGFRSSHTPLNMNAISAAIVPLAGSPDSRKQRRLSQFVMKGSFTRPSSTCNDGGSQRHMRTEGLSEPCENDIQALKRPNNNGDVYYECGHGITTVQLIAVAPK